MFAPSTDLTREFVKMSEAVVGGRAGGAWSRRARWRSVRGMLHALWESTMMRSMGTRPDTIYAWGAALPRTDAVVVNGRRKLRVGSMVYRSFDVAETVMGFAYPKLEREALVASAPDTFQLPRVSDLRFNWALARLEALDEDEAMELVLDAWDMVVPRFLARRTRLSLDMVRREH